MYIEINDAHRCTFITQQGGEGKLPPRPEQSRVCSQCEQMTWAHTATCMWCGHHRWARAYLWGGAGLALAACALGLWRFM